MNIHKDSFLKPDELGSRVPPYRPTFNYDGEYIDEAHRYFSSCPLQDGALIRMKIKRSLKSVAGDYLRRGSPFKAMLSQIASYIKSGSPFVVGWLIREDALKLYELAYFVKGDILELGAYHGLSSCIMSMANANSPAKKHIYSVDIHPSCIEKTRLNLEAMGLEEHVTGITDDAVSAVKEFAKKGMKFEFVFIDHSHEYDPVYGVCLELKKIVMRGGFCLFHDFNDARNSDPDDTEYDVYRAVTDGLSEDDFEFYGIYGSSALYRAK